MTQHEDNEAAKRADNGDEGQDQNKTLHVNGAIARSHCFCSQL
ncbi:MAG: hypothetical protein ACRDBH_07910 [Bosea sp. (in: a-proteobacteria)]